MKSVSLKLQEITTAAQMLPQKLHIDKAKLVQLYQPIDQMMTKVEHEFGNSKKELKRLERMLIELWPLMLSLDQRRIKMKHIFCLSLLSIDSRALISKHDRLIEDALGTNNQMLKLKFDTLDQF